MKTLSANVLRGPLLVLGLLAATQASASAQYFGGGYGYGGMGGGGYGGMGYGGFGGGGYGGMGGYGYGAYGGYGLNGYVFPGYGSPFGVPGVGYPGIGGSNPYFSFGLSPLAVENAAFERRVLGRRLPAPSVGRAGPDPTAPATYMPVGTGTFQPPQ